MQLKVKRSQKTSGLMGKPIFVLDARAILSGDEQGLVRKYNLGKTVVYDSQTRRKHTNAADDNFDAAAAVANYSVGGMLARGVRGAARAAAAALSLRVTIDSLTGGEHVECKELDELLGAETAMVDACQTVKGYLAAAATFDGREEVVEI
jgi:hypothetical protein